MMTYQICSRHRNVDEIFPTTIPVIHKIIEQTSKTSTVARNIINNEQLWLEEISATQTVR